MQLHYGIIIFIRSHFIVNIGGSKNFGFLKLKFAWPVLFYPFTYNISVLFLVEVDF